MATTKKKLKPPAPIGAKNPTRSVEVPPTVGKTATSQGDDVAVRKTRADFRDREFTRVIRQHGKYVYWRKALLCPCGTTETDQAALDCEDCNGSGYVYVQPQCIQALMFQFDKKTSIFEKFGLFQSGTVSVTVEPQFRPGYRDSYEMRDDVIAMNELLKKDDRRGRRSKLPAGVDSARFRIVNAASLLYKCSGGELVTLEEGLHFSITDEGWLRWTDRGNKAIGTGTKFSLHYDYHPIFLIDSWMHVQRPDVSGRGAPAGTPRAIALPVQAMAKLDFLLDINGVPSLDPIAQPTGIGPKDLELFNG
jgi:hypothetical protein